jgi:hypothetical protein
MARALSVILVPAFRYNLSAGRQVFLLFCKTLKRISIANEIHRTPMKNLNQ